MNVLIRGRQSRETGRYYDAGFEDRGRDHDPRKAGNFQKPEKTRFSLRAFRRNQLSWHLDLIPVKPILGLRPPEPQDNKFVLL